MKRKSRGKKGILFLALLTLFSCSQSPQPKNAHHFVVKAQPWQKSLHFTGTVQPLSESTLTSPLDAVVEKMNAHYGQMVKKGEVILTLNSPDLQKQFNDTLTDYLKAKDNYSIAKAKFMGTQDLWDSGLISKNNYLSEKSSIDTARVTLLQSTRKLSELLEKLDAGSTKSLSTLSLSDFNKVNTILTSQHNLIDIKATRDGVLLYPPKAGEDKAARITLGSAVKASQVIALIGDLSGISLEIEIPEIDIAQIHSGMNAIVSGLAFSKQPLSGKVVSVNAQASSTNNGLPVFTALVEVKKLTPAQQKTIKVGMSAAIELKIEGGKQLVIPIAAIKRIQGQNTVQLQQGSGIQSQVIVTGPALADSVVVESGLKEGDVIIYD